MRTRVHWYPNDPSPATGDPHKTEGEAREYAARRSAMVSGKVEVLSSDGKVISTYVAGEMQA